MAGASKKPIANRVRPSVQERALLHSGSGEEGDNASAEARQIASGKAVRDLKRESEESDHQRSENFRNNFEWAIILFMWVVALGFLALAICWSLNLVLPADRRWLSPADMHALQGVLTGGLLIGLVSDHIKRRIS